MGYLSAKEMREQADLEIALLWHLTSNHYPPLPEQMVPVARRAVELARAGHWNETMVLPKFIEYKGRIRMGVWEAVESMHLQAFID